MPTINQPPVVNAAPTDVRRKRQKRRLDAAKASVTKTNMPARSSIQNPDRGRKINVECRGKNRPAA